MLINSNLRINCKNSEIVDTNNIENYNSYSSKFNLIISLINFQSGNRNLLKSLLSNKEEEFSALPVELDYFKIGSNKKKFNLYLDFKQEEDDKISQNNNDYSKFYTKKNVDFLPELILYFGEDELCLLGYPFTMLENCEIIKAGKLKNLDVVKYLNFFTKYTMIEKRFGK